mmetsp:Transcript_27304/g.56930  ORF Transcript_27304/g.56930 Transcript_27304/m.56930 type:complete len:220 (+) Transcript_27304:626-1285(+)
MAKYHISFLALFHQFFIGRNNCTLRRRLVIPIIHQNCHILLLKPLHFRQISRHIVYIIMTPTQFPLLPRVINANQHSPLRIVPLTERSIRGSNRKPIVNVNHPRRSQLRNLLESLLVQHVPHLSQNVHPRDVVVAVFVGLVQHLEQRRGARPAAAAGIIGELELGVYIGHVGGGLGVVGAGDHADRGGYGLLGVAGEFFAFSGGGLFGWGGAGSVLVRF